MSNLTARVQNGRLILDVPTALPEGMELDLLSPDEDDRDRPDLAELCRALDTADAQIKAGQGVPVHEALDRIFHKVV